MEPSVKSSVVRPVKDPTVSAWPVTFPVRFALILLNVTSSVVPRPNNKLTSELVIPVSRAGLPALL